MSADLVLLVALLAFVFGLGIGWWTKGEYDAAERWGKEMSAMRRMGRDLATAYPMDAADDAARVVVDDLRLVFRGVPTEDGGEDILG